VDELAGTLRLPGQPGLAAVLHLHVTLQALGISEPHRRFKPFKVWVVNRFDAESSIAADTLSTT
jgi:hypothetical protein